MTFFEYSKVKWLHLTRCGGQFDKAVRCLCPIFSGFNMPKIIKLQQPQHFLETFRGKFFANLLLTFLNIFCPEISPLTQSQPYFKLLNYQTFKRVRPYFQVSATLAPLKNKYSTWHVSVFTVLFWFFLLAVKNRGENMCEILRSNFEDLFPVIEDAIVSADFLGKNRTCIHRNLCMHHHANDMGYG